MKTLIKISAVFLFCIICKAQQTEVPVMKYEDLEKRIQWEKEHLVVVNFWATTCAPCVKELPHFMEINNEYSGNAKFKMILVSLDRLADKERVLNLSKIKTLQLRLFFLMTSKE